MKKKDLLAMRDLRATKIMVRVAEADIPKKTKYSTWGGTYIKERYEYDLFMRCVQENGIMKVSLFPPRELRLRNLRSVFDLYIDRAAKKFITFDREKKRWLTSKLDRLDWDGKDWIGKRWASPADEKLIQSYFQTDRDAYSAILTFQRDVREEELQKRHKRETDPWDADLTQVPALPKDWEHWVQKVGIPEQFIFYDYVKKGVTHGYCSYCEKEVPIKSPRHNKSGKCPCCRHKITYKVSGRVRRLDTENKIVYLMQRCRDGLVIREFRVSCRYPRDNHWKPELWCYEDRRALFDCYGTPLRAYFWGTYKNQCERWIRGNNCAPSSYSWYYGNRFAGRIYGKTIPDLAKRGLNRTGLIEYIKRKIVLDPELYLAVHNKFPQLEQLSKASLPALVDECMERSTEFAERLNAGNATSLLQMLAINSQELKRLRDNNGGTDFLAWLRYERVTGKEIPDTVISWFCAEKIKVKDIQFITDRMSTVQIYNYLRRNMAKYNMASRDVIITWSDYLSMAVRFHLDTSKEIVFRTNKLRARHNELAALDDKGTSLRIGEIMIHYPHIESICKELKEKYEYSGENYIICAPDGVADILTESKILDLCIKNTDRYWERLDRQESYLLFLRRASKPNDSYYVVEIEPDGTVRQVRTFGDDQDKDIDTIRAFLLEWQSVIRQRLTQEDQKKAQVSHELREQEYLQLRNDQIKIHTGKLRGHLLVDVLTADLMENAAA